MPKRKNNVSTRKKFKFSALYSWIPGILGQGFAWVLLILFLAGVGMGVREVVYADPTLGLRTVRVFPADALSLSQLETIQKKYRGLNTAQIDLPAIARDLEKDHRILQAEVRRDLPDAIEIHIQRREPFAYLHYGKSGRWAMVSKDAVVLEVQTQPGQGLYTIENDQLSGQTPKIGMRVSRNLMQLSYVVDAFTAHPVAQSEKITSLVMLPNDSASLVLGDLSLKINLNDADPGMAFSKFQYLLETENRSVIEYVDLRFNRVILKRKTESSESETQAIPRKKKR